MIPTSLDNLVTTAAIGQWSKEVPPGHYDGFWLRATGGTAGASTEAIIGNIRMVAKAPWGNGDIHNITFPLLRRVNERQGSSLLETVNDTGGVAFAYSAFLPASIFGYPNSLWVAPGSSVKIHIDPNTAAVTSCSIAIEPVPYSAAPMNYLLQLGADRFPTLGGLATNPLRVPNLIGLGLSKASTTDPGSIHIKSRRRNWDIVPISVRRFSSWLWDMEAVTDVFALLPLFSRDIAEAIGDTYELVFSGGVGNIDYVTIQATMTPGITEASRNVIRAMLATGFADAGVNVTGAPQPAADFNLTNMLRGGRVAADVAQIAADRNRG